MTDVDDNPADVASGRFRWFTFDVNSLLHEGWQDEILKVAEEHVKPRVLHPPHLTSREDESVLDLLVGGVGGEVVSAQLPWLLELYRGLFRELGAQCFANEKLITAEEPRHAVVLNVQRGNSERYECHVDTNPVEGLLYVTSHPAGHGGELAVGNNVHAKGVKEIDGDCTVIYPQAGHLVFFDARVHPHYVRSLIQGDVRVAVAMNFYTPSAPESSRPADLDEYLFGNS